MNEQILINIAKGFAIAICLLVGIIGVNVEKKHKKNINIRIKALKTSLTMLNGNIDSASFYICDKNDFKDDNHNDDPCTEKSEVKVYIYDNSVFAIKGE